MMRALKWLMALTLLAVLAPALAQNLRDPTVSPVDAAITGVPAAGDSLQIGAGSSSVVMRDGRPYLVVGTRLYAQGEKLGQARIERITETEVWLREAGELHKVQRFSGVERHAVSSPTLGIGCAAGGLTSNPVRQTGKVVKAARTRKSRNGSDEPGFRVRSPAVAPCPGVRP